MSEERSKSKASELHRETELRREQTEAKKPLGSEFWKEEQGAREREQKNKEASEKEHLATLSKPEPHAEIQVAHTPDTIVVKTENQKGEPIGTREYYLSTKHGLSPKRLTNEERTEGRRERRQEKDRQREEKQQREREQEREHEKHLREKRNEKERQEFKSRQTEADVKRHEEHVRTKEQKERETKGHGGRKSYVRPKG